MFDKPELNSIWYDIERETLYVSSIEGIEGLQCPPEVTESPEKLSLWLLSEIMRRNIEILTKSEECARLQRFLIPLVRYLIPVESNHVDAE